MLVSIFKNKIFLSIVAVALVVGSVFWVTSGEDSPYEFIEVAPRDLVQEVSVTGTVEPVERVNLSFDRQGVLSRIYFEEGERVEHGEVIAQLKNDNLESDLAEARADVQSAQAELEKLLSGTRQEEIDLQRTKVKNAGSALHNAKQSLIDTLEDVYTTADNVVYNNIDQFFTNPRSGSPDFNVENKYDQIERDLELDRVRMQSELFEWEQDVNDLSLDRTLDDSVTRAEDNLRMIRLFLNDLSFIVNDLETSSDLTQSTIDDYKSDVKSARNDITSAISSLSTEVTAFDNAKSTLEEAEDELNIKLAGARPEDIKVQESNLTQAEARVQSLEASMDDTYLRSPISGVITRQDVETGEVVSSGENIAVVISEGRFEIKSNIPEVDIAKVGIGDKAPVTLDAFGSDRVFKARVVKIDSSETVVEGVTTYTTTFQFSEDYEGIRSGMTADIDIMTGEKSDVLAVPRRAVLRHDDGGKYVRVLRAENTVEEVGVETGMLASDGYVEITEGLEGGEKVITFVNN